jgi:Domain of unknown function (DUF4270)
MRKSSGAWLLSASTMAMLLLLAACTSPNDAGRDVLPQDDEIQGHYVDTFSIEMKTLLIDTTQTYNLSRNLFGNYVDEQFGHIFAETYIQTRVQGSNLTFGADPNLLTLDSIVLTLDLVDFYGRYNDPIPLEIFEITETFPSDSSLNSRSTLAADMTVDLADGYQVDFSQLAGFYDQISIRLNDSLGKKILFANPTNLASNTAFTGFFKGLLIRSKAVSQANSREPGGIFAFDPRGGKSFLKIYYKDNNAPKNYTFAINDNCQRFHNITRTDVTGRLLDQAATSTSSPLYGCVESGALVKLYLGMPSVKSLDPAIINRATLVLHVDPAFDGSIGRFDPPSEVFLLVADATKKNAANPNVINSTAPYEKNTHEYRIPMTKTLQQILSGALGNDGFIIVPGENGVTLNRAVFGGPGHPTLKPRLEVVYTDVPRR